MADGTTTTTETTAKPAEFAKAADKVPATTPRPSLNVGSKVTAIIPTDLDQVYRLAQWIAAAGWAPKGYLVDPKDPNLGFDQMKIAVGILHGMEVGFTPVGALQSICVINGMPSIWGDGALALVLSSPLCEGIEEHPIIDQHGMAGYECIVTRRGYKPHSRKFLREDMIAAGLDKKSGPWQEYRARMYQMRARAWALRDRFADVLRGLHITEEVQDMEFVRQSDGSFSPTQGESAKVEFPSPRAAARSAEPPPSQTQADPPQLQLVDMFGEAVDYTDPLKYVADFVVGIEKEGENFWENNSPNLSELRKAKDGEKLAQRVHDAFGAWQAEQERAKRAAEEAKNGKATDAPAPVGAQPAQASLLPEKSKPAAPPVDPALVPLIIPAPANQSNDAINGWMVAFGKALDAVATKDNVGLFLTANKPTLDSFPAQRRVAARKMVEKMKAKLGVPVE